MNRLAIVVVASFALIAPVLAAPANKPNQKAANTDVASTVWAGNITAISPASVTVAQGKAKSRTFQIYAGTVIGHGGKGTMADLTVGTHVTVSFSEVPGSKVAKAENISPPKEPKVGGPGKKKP